MRKFVLFMAASLGLLTNLALGAIQLDTSTPAGDEGTTASVVASLTAAPSETTTFTLAYVSGDTSITLGTTAYGFTTGTYATTQTISWSLASNTSTESVTAVWQMYPSEGDTSISTETITITSTNTDPYLIVSDVAPSGTEGGTAAITAYLSHAPSASTTFTLSSASSTSITLATTTYFYTSATYATPQTITFALTRSNNLLDNSATWIMYPSEGDTGISTKTLTVTNLNTPLYDNVEMDTMRPTGTEAGTAVAYVWLDQAPAVETTFTLASDSSASITLSTTTYGFTTENYATSQSITWTLVNDDVTDDITANWTMTPTSGDTSINVIPFVVKSLNTDPSSSAELEVSNATPYVNEGDTSTFLVSLSAAPWSKTGEDNVTTITVAKLSGSALVTASPATLVFTQDNYATSQTVTLTGVRDKYTYDAATTSFSLTATGGDTSITSTSVVVSYFNSGFYGDTTSITSYSLTYQDMTLDQITTPATGVVATFKFIGGYSPKNWFKVYNLDATATADVFFNDIDGEYVSNFGGDVQITTGSSYTVTKDTGLMPLTGISSLSMYLDDKTTPTLKVRAK